MVSKLIGVNSLERAGESGDAQYLCAVAGLLFLDCGGSSFEINLKISVSRFDPSLCGCRLHGLSIALLVVRQVGRLNLNYIIRNSRKFFIFIEEII